MPRTICLSTIYCMPYYLYVLLFRPSLPLFAWGVADGRSQKEVRLRLSGAWDVSFWVDSGQVES